MREGKIMKKLNKKNGFTLAELLIVVAIIAILVAIAVPVFSGALAEAERAVENANIRAARAQASVDYMINHREKELNGKEAVKYVYTVSKNGELEQKGVPEPTSKDDDKCGEPIDTDGDNIAYRVTVYISGEEIKLPESTPGGSDDTSK